MGGAFHEGLGSGEPDLRVESAGEGFIAAAGEAEPQPLQALGLIGFRIAATGHVEAEFPVCGFQHPNRNRSILSPNLVDHLQQRFEVVGPQFLRQNLPRFSGIFTNGCGSDFQGFFLPQCVDESVDEAGSDGGLDFPALQMAGACAWLSAPASAVALSVLISVSMGLEQR